MRRSLVAAALVSILALTGCSASDATGASPAPTDRTVVPWSDYESGLQKSIDDMQAKPDCDGLDDALNKQLAENEEVVKNTDHGNVEVMKYIDEASRLAGCY